MYRKNPVRGFTAAAFALFPLCAVASSDAMAVRQLQRPFQQTMTVRADNGSVVAKGDFSQTVVGDTVTMHLMYRFLDGSTDEETTVYRQHGSFQLLRDHHVQQGPFFSKPFDFLVDASAKTTTSLSISSDGAVNVNTHDAKLPSDLANGFIGTLLLNSSSGTKAFTTTMMVPFNGGRLVHLRVSRDREQTFSTGGKNMKATVYRVHPDLGGFIGILAGLLGLKPKDVMVWISQGDDPVVIRTVGQLGGYGPIVSADVDETTFNK